MHLIKVALFGLFGLYFGAGFEANAEPGFNTLRTANVPEEVRLAAGKVLEIWTPAVTSIKTPRECAQIQAELFKSSTLTMRVFMRQKINSAEIKFCQKHKMKTCRVTERVGRGSAFVVNGSILVTARHNFSQGSMGLAQIHANQAANWREQLADPSLRNQAESEIESFKRDPMKDTLFFLTDSQGHIVFSSITQAFRFLRYGNVSKFEGVVDFNGEPPLANLQDENFLAERREYSGADWINQDVAQVQLSVKLPGLETARENCFAGSASFNVGYPGATTTRKVLHFPEAQDRELSVAKGVVLSAEQFVERGSEWPDMRRFLSEMVGRRVLFTDVDSTQGLSGGPILNGNGQVCGINKAFFPGGEKIEWDTKGQFFKALTIGIPFPGDEF